MTQEAEQIMKRCQAGTRNYDEANNLHAACYGLIGKLLAQRKPLSAEQVSKICAEWTDENGNTGSFGRRQIARAIEAAHGIKGGA
jgi:hypothetical protein